MLSTPKKVMSIVILLVMVFSITGCLKSDKAKIEETVTTFLMGLKDENKEDIESVLDLDFPGRNEFLADLDSFFILMQYSSYTIQNVTITVTSDIATASVVSIVSGIYDGESFSGSMLDNFNLAKRGGKWYITEWY